MATYYWVGGSGTWNNTNTTNWSNSSGGAGGFGPPTSVDQVYFTSGSASGNYTVTMASTAAALAVDMSNPAGGVVDLNLSGSPTIGDGFIFNSGTITLNSNTLTIGWFSSSNTNTRTIAFGTTGGQITCTSNNIIVWSTNTSTNFTYTGNFNVLSNYAGSTGTRTFNLGALAVGFNSTSAVPAIRVSTSGTDTITFSGTAVGNVDLTGFTGTYSHGSVTLAGSIANFTMGAGTTVAASNNTLTVTTTSSCNITSNGKTLDFPVTFNGGATASYSFTGDCTFGSTRTCILTSGTISTIASGNVILSVGFFSSSNSNTRSIVFNSPSTSAITITGSNGTVWDCGTLTGFTTNSANAKINFTSSATIGTRTINHGSTAGGTLSNTASFNITSGTDTVTFSNPSIIYNLSTVGFGGTFSNVPITLHGSLTWGATTNLQAGTSVLTLAQSNATPVQQITSNGRTMDFPVTMNGSSSQIVRLMDDCTIGSTRTFTFTQGNIELTGGSGNWTLSTGLFNASNTNNKTIAFGTGNITLTGTGTVWTTATGAANLTHTGTSNIRVSNNSGTATTVNVGSPTASTVLNFSFTTGTYTLTETGASYRSLDFSGFSGTLQNVARTIRGGLTLSATMTTNAGNNTTTFAATSGTNVLRSNGKSIDFPITFNGVGGTWQLFDNWVVGVAALRAISVSAGTLDLNAKTLSGFYSLTNTATVTGVGSTMSPAGASSGVAQSSGTLTMTNGTINAPTITFTAGTIGLSGANLTSTGTINWNGGTFTLTGLTVSTVNFTQNGGNYNNSVATSLTATGLYTLTSGTLTLGNPFSVARFTASGSTARTIAFGASGVITLTGNNATILDLTTVTNLTVTGTPYWNSTYTGATGTRTFTTGVSEAQANAWLNVSTAGASGLVLGTTATDIVALTGNYGNIDLSGFTNTLSNTARTVFGNFTLPVSGGTFSTGANATTFGATSGTKNITSNGRTIDFPLTFSGVGGTFQLQDNCTVGATQTTTLTNGSLLLGSFTLSTGLFASANANIRTLDFGTGKIQLSAATAVTVWNTSTITNLTISGTPIVETTGGGATTKTINNTSNLINFNILNPAGTVAFTASNSVNNLTVNGSVTISNVAISIFGNFTATVGTFTAGANAWTFAATSGTQTITSNGITLNFPFIKSGVGGTLTLADALTAASLTVTSGSFTTSASNYNMTLGSIASNNSNVRSISLNGSTVTLSGVTPIDFTTITNLTFNAGTSTINCSSATATFNGGGLTFYDVGFTAATVGAKSVTGANTFNNLSLTASATGLSELALAASQTVNNAVTCVGTSAITRGFIRSNTAGTTRTITAASVSASDCDFRDVTISGAAAGTSVTRGGDCGGNSGITFPASKPAYWNLAGTQTWNATGWALTSTGTPDVNNFPLAQDVATFTDDGATDTVNFGAVAYNFPAIDASARTLAMTLGHNGAQTIYGSYTLGSGVTISGTSAVTFAGTSTQTITSAGKTITFPITIGIAGRTATSVGLGDSYVASNSITVTAGTFSASNQNITCTAFSSNNANVRTINMGSGTWTLSSTGTVWDTGTITNITFNRDTSNIVLSDVSTTARTFSGGGLTYPKLTIGGATGTSTTTINGVNTFSELASTKTVAHTITFGANQTFDEWTVKGTAGNVVTINSSAAGTQRTLTKSTGFLTNIDYLNVRDIVGSPQSDTWYIGANSTYNTTSPNNAQFLFLTERATNAVVVLTSTVSTSWTVPADWSNSANTIHLIGGGGGGAGSRVSGNNRAGGGGGGGGGYTRLTNQTLTSGASITYECGIGGTLGTAGVDGGNGGTTSWNSGAATAGGGGGGQATTTPTSTGGTPGTGSTFNGGVGGVGSFGTTANQGYGGGGGGGAAGPNGAGGNGGNGFASTNANNIAGGGGGGNGGGTNGGNATAATGGTGGNTSLGSGGGASGVSGVNGGGGGGSVSTASVGGIGRDVFGAGGGGGGGGGEDSVRVNTGGLYGAGGGGAGTTTVGTQQAGAAGAQGAIIIVYTPGGGPTPPASTNNMFFLF